MTSLCALAACGAPKSAEGPPAPSPTFTTSTSTSTPTPTATATATPTPTPTSTPTSPPPTGGSVLIGEIAASKNFDPRPTLLAFQPQLLSCYNQVRASNASLHGKLKLEIQINEAGTVLSVTPEAGGSANDPTFVACIADAMGRLAHFPKPGGTATVIAPLVFRP